MAELPMLAPFEDENDRLAFLQRLVDELTLKERKALSSMISKKNDVLARLPVELVIAVMDHLPMLHTWKLQIVCKHWRNTLSSEQLLSAALTRWETHSDADRVTTKIPPNMTTTPYRIRHMQSFRQGRPFTQAVKQVSLTEQPYMRHALNQRSRTFALSGHLFAYVEAVPGSHNRVVVMDLVARRQTRYQGKARERIQCIAVTDTIVAYISFNGKLYTSYHDHTRLGSFQLPSALVVAFAADKDSVSIVLGGPGDSSESVNIVLNGSSIVLNGSGRPSESMLVPKYTLLIHNCASQRTTSFPLPAQEVPKDTGSVVCTPSTLLLNAEAEIVDIFSFHGMFTDLGGESFDDYVEHRRYSFTGAQLSEPLSASSWSRAGVRGTPGDTGRDVHLGDIHPSGIDGLYTIRTSYLQSANQDLPSSTASKYSLQMLLTFDSRSGELSEHTFDNDQRDFATSPLSGWHPANICPVLWKDVEIRADPRLVFSVENDRAQWHSKGRFKVQRILELGSARLQCELFANDSFLVAVEETRSTAQQRSAFQLRIYCFEEGLTWGGEGLAVRSVAGHI